MSDGQIERVFSALSRIEANQANAAKWMDDHAENDKELFKGITDTITAMKIAHARQKGFITALAGVATFVSALIGYAIEYFASGRAHH